MRLRYDEDFVEAAVHLCVTDKRKGIPSLQLARFNRERERLYNISDPDERNTAFFRLHLEWFREWGLEELLTELLREFPLLPKSLTLLAFRKSRGKNDDGTELYVNEAGERTGVLALRPESLLFKPELHAFLYHELTHLNDMVEPAFGYRPELPEAGPFPSQHRLARERYRLLWDISIDGRLTRSGRKTTANREQRWLEFVSTFAFWPEARREQVFEEIWTHDAPTHQMLLGVACDARHLELQTGPGPGSPCPLCGFPTFAWAEPGGLTGEVRNAIQAEFPHWTSAQGACARCAAIYRLRPATAFAPELPRTHPPTPSVL